MTPQCMALPLGLRGFGSERGVRHSQSERQLVEHPGPSRSVRYERCVAMQRHPIRGPRPACLADLEKCFGARFSLVVEIDFRDAPSCPSISVNRSTEAVYHRFCEASGYEPGGKSTRQGDADNQKGTQVPALSLKLAPKHEQVHNRSANRGRGRGSRKAPHLKFGYHWKNPCSCQSPASGQWVSGTRRPCANEGGIDSTRTNA